MFTQFCGLEAEAQKGMAMDWNVILDYIKVFAVGGLICVVGQILIDKTRLTPAKILVLFVTAGAILTCVGVYQRLVEFGGSGATVPLTGFGYMLAKGAMLEAETKGVLGAFTGGLKAAAGGICAAVVFGYVAGIVFKPKAK